MADEFEFQRRFDYRKRMVDAFYKDIDIIYRELRTVPSDQEAEQRQKSFVVNELRKVQNRMDVFIKDLYD